MPSVAARFAAWAQKRSGPAAAPAGGRGGLPFLSAQFPDGLVWVEAAFGADLSGSPDAWPWVDITADVRRAARLRMRVGRADDTSVAQSASCGFDLDNTTSAYSAYNPASANYPNVRRNTPIRVRIDLGAGPSVVWQGYAVGFTPSWDASAQLANVSVVAAGTLRRLGQGNTPIRSALTRSILQSTAATLCQFWPCEDPTGSNQAASALSGGAAMTANSAVDWNGMDLHGSLTGTITLSPGTQFGYQSLPRLTTGGKLSASFPATSITSGSWTVQYTAYMDPITNDSSVVVAQWREGPRLWQVISDGLSLDTSRLVVNGTTICTEPHVFINEDQIITATQVGADISVSYKPNFARTAQTATITGATLGGITQFVANPKTPTLSGDFSIGEVRIWDGIPETFQSVTTSAWSGWVGETAGDRLTRLCREEGIALAMTGTSTETMGLQPVSTFLSVLRECETVDGGFLFDGFGPGLGYVTRTARYNLPASITIDVSAGQLSPPFAPVDDDQRIRNDVTVTRPSGSSGRFVDTDGPLGTDAIGTYDTSIQANTYDDTLLATMASWQVHLGTFEGLRYPNLNLDFVAVPALAQAWINATGPAFRADVVNADSRATQHPPDDVSLVVEGWTMNLDQVGCDVTASCSRQEVWRVGVVDSPDMGRVGASDTILAADIDASVASFLVTYTYAWSAAGGDYPFDILIGGERMTLSSVAGTTFNVTRGVNGFSGVHHAGDAVVLYQPAVAAL